MAVETGYVKLSCQDGAEFFLPRGVLETEEVKESFLGAMFHPGLKEGQELQARIKEVASGVFEKILCFVMQPKKGLVSIKSPEEAAEIYALAKRFLLPKLATQMLTYAKKNVDAMEAPPVENILGETDRHLFWRTVSLLQACRNRQFDKVKELVTLTIQQGRLDFLFDQTLFEDRELKAICHPVLDLITPENTLKLFPPVVACARAMKSTSCRLAVFMRMPYVVEPQILIQAFMGTPRRLDENTPLLELIKGVGMFDEGYGECKSVFEHLLYRYVEKGEWSTVVECLKMWPEIVRSHAIFFDLVTGPISDEMKARATEEFHSLPHGERNRLENLLFQKSRWLGSRTTATVEELFALVQMKKDLPHEMRESNAAACLASHEGELIEKIQTSLISLIQDCIMFAYLQHRDYQEVMAFRDQVKLLINEERREELQRRTDLSPRMLNPVSAQAPIVSVDEHRIHSLIESLSRETDPAPEEIITYFASLGSLSKAFDKMWEMLKPVTTNGNLWLLWAKQLIERYLKQGALSDGELQICQEYYLEKLEKGYCLSSQDLRIAQGLTLLQLPDWAWKYRHCLIGSSRELEKIAWLLFKQGKKILAAKWMGLEPSGPESTSHYAKIAETGSAQEILEFADYISDKQGFLDSLVFHLLFQHNCINVAEELLDHWPENLIGRFVDHDTLLTHRSRLQYCKQGYKKF
jgi:hypothetical protein